MATTTWSARTVGPPSVLATTPPATRASPVIRVPSWIRTPRSRATRARPRHSFAGSSRTSRPGGRYKPGLPDGGVDLGLDGRPVQELDVFAVFGGLVDPGPELVDLVGLVGQRERPGLLEVALDAVVAGEGDEPAQVREPFGLEAFQLVREVADPVGQAVGQRGFAEAAVPAARPERDRLRLDDDDAQCRVGVGQGEGRPEPGEPGPDDQDIGRRVRGKRRTRGRRLAAKPIAGRPG